jgi:ABC-type phosphate transport system permease subunit
MGRLTEFFILIVSVLSIASASIGIQAIGQPDQEDPQFTNWEFLIGILVMSIIALLVSMYLIYQGLK